MSAMRNAMLSRLSNDVDVAVAHPLDDATACLPQLLHQQSFQRQFLLLLLMLRLRHPLDDDVTTGLLQPLHRQCPSTVAAAAAGRSSPRRRRRHWQTTPH